MKKTFMIILIGAIIFLLMGCAVDPPTYYFDADEMLEKVIKIELVECENNNPTRIYISDNVIPSFDISTVKVIRELSDDKVDDFINELSTVTFHIENESVNSPVGYAVLIYTENNEIIVLSCTVLNDGAYSMVSTFTVDGKFINHIAGFADEPKYRKILEKYFEV